MYTEKTFQLPNNLNIHALCWGDPHKPMMLALHGWLDNAASFASLGPLLKDHYVIAIDLPGHGHSSHLASSFDYMLPNQLSWLHPLINQLATPTITLLGHSMGAAIASMYAACFPKNINKLILLDMLGPLNREIADTTEKLSQSILAISTKNPSKTLYPDIESMVNRRVEKNALPADLMAPMVKRGSIAVTGGYQWTFDARLLLPSSTCLSEPQILDLLSNITCPNLTIMSEQILMHHSTQFEARYNILQHNTLATVDAGHHLHLEQSVAVAKIINEWLDKS